MGQNDTISKIELIHLSILSTDNTNYRNDIHKFSNSLCGKRSKSFTIPADDYTRCREPHQGRKLLVNGYPDSKSQ